MGSLLVSSSISKIIITTQEQVTVQSLIYKLNYNLLYINVLISKANLIVIAHHNNCYINPGK